KNDAGLLSPQEVPDCGAVCEKRRRQVFHERGVPARIGAVMQRAVAVPAAAAAGDMKQHVQTAHLPNRLVEEGCDGAWIPGIARDAADGTDFLQLSDFFAG